MACCGSELIGTVCCFRVHGGQWLGCGDVSPGSAAQSGGDPAGQDREQRHPRHGGEGALQGLPAAGGTHPARGGDARELRVGWQPSHEAL